MNTATTYYRFSPLLKHISWNHASFLHNSKLKSITSNSVPQTSYIQVKMKLHSKQLNLAEKSNFALRHDTQTLKDTHTLQHSLTHGWDKFKTILQKIGKNLLHASTKISKAGFFHGLEEVNTDVRFSAIYFPPPCQKNLYRVSKGRECRQKDVRVIAKPVTVTYSSVCPPTQPIIVIITRPHLISPEPQSSAPAPHLLPHHSNLHKHQHQSTSSSSLVQTPLDSLPASYPCYLYLLD